MRATGAITQEERSVLQPKRVEVTNSSGQTGLEDTCHHTWQNSYRPLSTLQHLKSQQVFGNSEINLEAIKSF